MTDGLPDLGVLIAEGRLRPQDPDLVALRAMLAAAEGDLEAASVARESLAAGRVRVVFVSFVGEVLEGGVDPG